LCFEIAGCGVTIGKVGPSLGAQRRIVGGDEAGFGSFPWQVSCSHFMPPSVPHTYGNYIIVNLFPRHTSELGPVGVADLSSTVTMWLQQDTALQGSSICSTYFLRQFILNLFTFMDRIVLCIKDEMKAVTVLFP
jgi:hypothetical protein